MKLTDEQKKVIQQQHDSFCKTVMKNEARNCYEEENRFNQNNTFSFDCLSDSELTLLYEMDICQLEHTQFIVKGYPVIVSDSRIAKALITLSERKREVILLSFFVGMNDREIAKLLKLAPSTVFHHKQSALALMREEMGMLENDE